MKKLLVVLLSLGLIVAFSATASADTRLTFGGEYYLYGVYVNNNSLNEDTPKSTAYFWTRSRLQPVIKVADGLTFTAQLDFLEKKWGNTSWRRGGPFDGGDTTGTVPSTGSANQAAQEQVVEANRGFVTFNTAAGRFMVGYQAADVWGTDIGNQPSSRPAIQFRAPIGPVTLALIYEKYYEAASAAAADLSFGKVDADIDSYKLAGVYKARGVEAGLLYSYTLNKYRTTAAAPYTGKVQLLSPYLKATFGPVYVESEVMYYFGTSKEYKDKVVGTPADVKVDALTFYLNGKFNMGPAYVGAIYAWSSANDPDDATKDKQYGGQGLARGWNGPGLLIGNDDGTDFGTGNATVSSGKTNFQVLQVYGGYKPTPKLELWAGLLYATAVKKPYNTAGNAATEFLSDKIGTEFDVTATYQLYDNLSYMVGAGYLWAGDWFKANNAAAKVANDYLLINKLTLSF